MLSVGSQDTKVLTLLEKRKACCFKPLNSSVSGIERHLDFVPGTTGVSINEHCGAGLVTLDSRAVLHLHMYEP